MQPSRFPGLDTLRFLAASAVVVGHVPLNQESLGLPHPAPWAAFYRGAPAVSFFFTLSGFLITYLLLEERRRTGTIDVRRFYLRRAFRIWPLYFAVAAFGLFFYNTALPALGIPYPVEYRLITAVGLYTLFLPNLMNSLYTVGGILNPLWSIGIEEQFYLTWAPLLRRAGERLPAVLGTIVATSFTLSVANEAGLFTAVGWATKFVGQLEFHFMAIGALWAWGLHRHRERLLAMPVFRSTPLQLLLLALLADFYLLDLVPKGGTLGAELFQMTLYGWLIVEVAANPRAVVRLTNPATEYLGRISYGIYMLHMPAVYATTMFFLQTDWWRGNVAVYLSAYYAIAFAATVVLAAGSHQLLEQPFLRRKQRFSAWDVAPAATTAARVAAAGAQRSALSGEA